MSVTAGLREQRRAEAGRRDQRRNRQRGAKVIATSVPDASALRDPLKKASSKGIEIITVNSGLGAFDSLPNYDGPCRTRRRGIAGQGAGKQFKKAGAKKVLIVIHEASNSGLQQRAAGSRRSSAASEVKVLTIPNAKSDIPGRRPRSRPPSTRTRASTRFSVSIPT